MDPTPRAEAAAPVSHEQGNETAPRLSFGIPVRDAERFLPRLLDSLLAQDFPDFEVVVTDNASTDGTERVVRDFAERDGRVRYVRNERDIGQIENFNRVFQLSRGAYFRWIGADDWLEPTYASRCIATMQAHPEAIGITTLWRMMDDDGKVEFRRYDGRRPDAPGLVRRLHRTLWFLQANRLFFDPIYSMLRRDVLLQTELLPINQFTDRLLALELCRLGPFCHLDECLATRRNAREPVPVLLARYHEEYRTQREKPLWRMYADFAGVVRAWPVSAPVKLACWMTVTFHWLRAEVLRRSRRISGAIRRRLARG